MPRARKDTPNAHFGAYITRLAVRAGLDMTHGGSGRKELADRTEMSVWAIARILSGESLPKPENFQKIAMALGADTAELLTEARVLPRHTGGADAPDGGNEALVSVSLPVSPDQMADLLGVTHPMVRPGLITYMEQAVRLQHELDRGEGKAATGG